MSTHFDLDVNQGHKKKTAREIENIAEENFEGLDAGGVFEFSMNG